MAKPKKLAKKTAVRRHPTRHLHLARISWFSVLLIGLLFIQVTYNFQQTGAFRVLAYATNVNHGDLLAGTNNNRAANGLAGLAANSKLTNAAQAKAQHMIDNDYWAHNAPDGTTPWYFMAQYGYDYVSAGENLAYGFADSAGVIQGWMNSPGHKANVLGDYTEIGFGYADGANFQGGENTVVVAMYGKPKVAPAPPAPTPAAPAPQVQPAPAPAPVPAEPAPTPVPTPEPKPEPESVPATTTPPNEPAPTELPTEETRITTIQALFTGKANWAIYASLALVGAVTTGFAATHLELMRRALLRGERFVLLHPAIDAGAITAILALLLATTYGIVK